MNTHRQNGFTAIEALVVGTLVIILAGITAPSIRTLVERNRTETEINTIFNALITARSESIARNQITILCKSSNQSSCTTSGEWEQGWIVFVDKNSSGSLEAGEEIVHRGRALSSNFTLRTTASINHSVLFLATGATNSAASFKLCPPSKDRVRGYTLLLSVTGSARLNREVDVCP